MMVSCVAHFRFGYKAIKIVSCNTTNHGLWSENLHRTGADLPATTAEGGTVRAMTFDKEMSSTSVWYGSHEPLLR